MAYTANMRVWRGDGDDRRFVDYQVPAEEGEVVLDIIHRLQATQAGDLAVRWNCKAGKCGSCSAEINGKPRLLCMTRMNLFEEGATITVAPMKTFPLIRDLVTDVSFNYEVAKRVPEVDLEPAGADGTRRMFQEDINRLQEFRKCIECFMCQDVCHVIRDHDENKKAFAGPRFFLKYAELDMHPLARNEGAVAAQGPRRPRLLQHHQVLQRGLSRGHPHHRQRDHPAEGAHGRLAVGPAVQAGPQEEGRRSRCRRCCEEEQPAVAPRPPRNGTILRLAEGDPVDVGPAAGKAGVTTIDVRTFVSHFVMDRVPHLFVTRESYVEWKQQLADGLSVDPYAVTIVGSASTGFSLNPNKQMKEFDHDSDVDVAVVSARHFDEAWHFLRSLNPAEMLALPPVARQAVKSHRQRYVFDGCIATDRIVEYLPFGPSWVQTLATVAALNPVLGRVVNARLYRDHGALRSYQVQGLTKLRDVVLGQEFV